MSTGARVYRRGRPRPDPVRRRLYDRHMTTIGSMADIAAAARPSGLLARFRFAENGTTLARDTAAGTTTFAVMSYIIFVNPTILSFTGVRGLESRGLPFAGVLTATCLVAAAMSIAMGLY